MLPNRRDYDKRIFRLVFILNRLDQGKKVSSRELAEEFNVSIRSIQRDLAILNTAGFLINSPEKGVYAFEEGFSLKKIKLSQEEASLLTFLCDISQSLGEKFEASFKKILRKVIQQEYDSPFYAKLPAGAQIAKDLPFISELEEAIDACQKIKVKYMTQEGRIKRFILDPLKIIYFDGFWYLLSQVSGKDWLLKFRLERLKDVEVSDQYFDPPVNLKTMLDQSVNIWFSEDRDKKVVLKVNKEVAKFFKERTYFPLQKIVKENKDGSLVVEAKVAQYMEVIPTVMQWIPNITVVRPKKLKTNIRDIVKKYLSELKEE